MELWVYTLFYHCVLLSFLVHFVFVIRHLFLLVSHLIGLHIIVLLLLDIRNRTPERRNRIQETIEM